MRAVIQRVSEAAVTVEGRATGRIGRGLLVLLAVGHDDAEPDAEYMAEKIAGLRIFPDDAGKMNRSLREIGGGVLVVSQFTLFGDARKGRRPSFIEAAPPERANALYERVVARLRAEGVAQVETGEFQAMMRVSLVNDGPVTILLEA